ncbi:hypothetical protein DFH09DRAFT_229581, partial [Mycena vulgaris]
MRIHQAALPVLNLAKASVTGIGIPGVEPVINGVLELATLIDTMHSNKEDLSQLDQRLDSFIAIDTSGCGENLRDRLTTLVSQLTAVSVECKALAGKHRFERLFISREHKDRIQGIRSAIASHIQEFTFYSNISIEKLVTDMAFNMLAKQILSGVKWVSASYDAEDTPDMCMEGTRVDIVQEIIARLTGTDTAQRIIMLTGSAGSGKSTIAKTVASALAEDHILTASFFFSRDHAERKEIKLLPTTLAYQLAGHDAGFERLLVKFLDVDRSGVLSAGPRVQFQKLIVDLLAKMPPSQTPWVICLDALDECGKEHATEVLRWLSEGISRIPAHIRFFLTGRPNVPSYLKSQVLHSSMYQLVLDQMDGITVEGDIHRYVERSLDGNTWPQQESWKAEARDVDLITKQAGGLFVFAATAVRYIRAGLPQHHPQESVDYLLKGVQLNDLDDLYYRIVNEAVSLPAPRDLRASEYRDCAMRILGTILQLSEPLEPQALAALLNMEEDDIRRKLLPLSAVIGVPDTSGGTIRIIHASFREFMTSAILDRRSDLLCDTADQRHSLVSNLIRILQSKLKFNICDLPTSYLRNVDFPDIRKRLNDHIPQHLQYSCRFWADHLARTSFDSDLAQEAGKFLLDKFLFWLEVLSLLGLVGHAPPALSNFLNWTKDTSAARFANDAKRFIAFFGPAISQSAPHIYLSALGLAPLQSEISARFQPLFPGVLGATTGQMKEWPATIAVLDAHASQVYSVAYSRDGKYIASASDDETVRVWDAQTG